jgi:hypothetical protein
MLLYEHYKGQKIRQLIFIQIQNVPIKSFVHSNSEIRKEVFFFFFFNNEGFANYKCKVHCVPFTTSYPPSKGCHPPL